MPRLVVGYTELGCGKLKKGNGFLEPNFELWPKPEQSHVSDDGVRAKDVAIQISEAGSAIRGEHAAAQNLFNLGRYLVRAEHYRDLKVSAFEEWSRKVA